MPKLHFLIAVFLITTLHVALAHGQTLEWEVGLTSDKEVIRALGIEAVEPSSPTVLYLAGLEGVNDSSAQSRLLLSQYGQLPEQQRAINLIVIPVANPESEALLFPPTGNAYAERPVENAVWRWIGVHAPDLIILAGPGGEGFKAAAETEPVAGIGTVPVVILDQGLMSIDRLLEYSDIEKSAARLELERRLARTPDELAEQLAGQYGYDFSTPAYVPGMGLIGRLRLGYVDEVEELLNEYLSGDRIEINNPSVMAGQLVFAQHAEQTANPNSLERVVQAADLAFDEQGNLREFMPFHNEMSDSVFMAPPLLVKAGKLAGNGEYFDMVERHVNFMQQMLLREDGLYNHSPLADVAWSRGNAFPVLGLAMVLSDFPEEHPAFDYLMDSYVAHLEVLRPYQNTDGLWRQVIDYPGSYSELSSTSMIGIAIKRGIDRGWLDVNLYQPVLDSIWQAVLKRTSFNGEFIDVCTSTGKQDSLDAYLNRLAIFGRDDRAGGMVMNLAIEMAELVGVESLVQ